MVTTKPFTIPLEDMDNPLSTIEAWLLVIVFVDPVPWIFTVLAAEGAVYVNPANVAVPPAVVTAILPEVP